MGPENAGIAVETRGQRWWFGIALFLLIWGGKLVVIERYTNDVPQTDQWYAEGQRLLLPYVQGRLEATAFVQPHNEHRIVFTRALVLSQFIVNGQWDARVELVVNAALHAAYAVAIFFWGCTVVEPRWRWRWLIFVVGLTALPVAWENAVSGFNSQQYLLLWFSLGALALLLTARPWTGRWWVGLGCATLALGTMASGLLASGVVAGILAVSIRSRADWRRDRATILACAAIFMAGLALHPSVPYANQLQARSPMDFLMALSRYLQWQYERLFWFRNEPTVVLAPLHWLPWGWLVWRWWRCDPPLQARERVILAAGAWALLQFAASAYARGAGAPWVASRYVDTLLVGVGVNALALALWWSKSSGRPWRQRRMVFAALTGYVCTIIGLCIHVAHFFTYELPRYRDLVDRRSAGLQEYLVTGDRSIFLREDPPYQTPISPADLLDVPEMRAILPRSLQPANAPTVMLTKLADYATRAAPFVVVIGLVALFLAMRRGRPPTALIPQ